jgi:hypothetical protein
VLREVIQSIIALPEYIGLHIATISSYPFPVDFIEVVRQKDEGADNTSARGGLNSGRDLAKHDVLFRDQCRCLVLLGNHEIGSVRVVRH